MLALLLMLTSAHASSLDLLEVGGPWGTPAATNPTAVWWNPAGLAAGEGTQFLVEGAPTLAAIQFDRTNPDYGAPADNPQWNYGGEDNIKFNGVVPFLGVSTDFGIDNLGVGFAVGVPFARGGTQDPIGGPGKFHLREGTIQAVYAMAGAGWTFGDKVSVGLSGALVDSTWQASTNVETLSALRDGIRDTGFGNYYCEDDETGPCQDWLFEDPGYSAELNFDTLKDTAFTFGAGVYLTPIDKVGISVAYSHGVRLEHTGGVDLSFGCPPDSDFLGAVGSDQAGLCNGDAEGTGTIGYNLPSRINAGVVLYPVDRVRAELMGGWVGWSAFTDYDIQTDVKGEAFHDEVCTDADGNPAECNDTQAGIAEETAHLVSQDRQWARDNRDSFWVGADGKVQVTDRFTVGGRLMYDHSAIPASVLSTNNYDAGAVIVGGLVAFEPIEQIGIALSYGHQFLMTRTVTDSAFDVTLVESEQRPDRYFYPSANGTYRGSINRIGVSVRGQFGTRRD